MSKRRGVLSERERDAHVGFHDYTSIHAFERAVLLAAARRLTGKFKRGSIAAGHAGFGAALLRLWAKELTDGE